MPVHVIAWVVLCCHSVSRGLGAASFPAPPPAGHHLLLQHPAVAVALPPVARRQMEVLPAAVGAEREPSCAELRSMWRHMRRMGRQMEFTNEIPKLRDPFTASALRYGGGARRRPSKYPDPNPYASAKSSSQVFQKAAKFGDGRDRLLYDASPNTVLDNGGFSRFDDYPGSKFVGGAGGTVPGRFADTPLPEASLGSYGTVVHTPEERARFRALARRPPEYRRFGTRWGDSTGLGRVPFRAGGKAGGGEVHYGSVVTHGERHPFGGFAEFPLEVGQRSGAARVERIDRIPLAGKLKLSCLRLQNRKCKTDVDCHCSGGSPLFCGGNRCRSLYKASKYGKQKWGKSWYTEPYESSLLGYSPKRDPVWPGPF